MAVILRRLALGLALIALASGILLVSDSPRLRGQKRLPRAAILQHASTLTLDDGVRGMVAGLEEKGYVNGRTIELHRFNAEGDVSTASSIAQEIVNGRYDVALTSSTPSLQALANANRDGRVTHVFGLVADPYSAGVGLTRGEPLRHPPHLVGLGISLPVPDAIRFSRTLYPALTTIGMAWNPAESNSQAVMAMARPACKELNLTLLEAGADNTSAVAEACESLIARGAECICVGGDVTVSSAIDVVIAAAKKARVPVFTVLPGDPERGTLFDYGSNFFEVGKLTGLLAGDVLHGTDPRTVPIRDAAELAPHAVTINKRVLTGLKDPWRAPDEALQKATIVVDETGVHRKDAR